MDDKLCQDLLHILHKETFIKHWINKDYKTKPLLIYGNSGIFKSTLADYIIKDYSNIKIDIEFCKSKISFNEYIERSLNKYSIKMMFKDNKYNIKSLIIDDLDYIYNEKKLFNQIIDWIYNLNNYKIPIIFIINDIKLLKKIDGIFYKLHIKLKDHEYNFFCETYFLNELKNKNINIKELLKKSNYNFNSLKNNLLFHKSKISNIQNYLCEEKNTINTLYKILNNDYSIDELIIICSYNRQIISFNILENLSNITNNINIIDKIYYNQVLYDNLYYDKLIFNDINYIYTIIYPIYLLKNVKLFLKKELIYNKYISKSIIYIYNSKIFNFNDIIILYLYIKNNYEKLDKNRINELFDIYLVKKEKLIKFSKLYNYFNKNDINNIIKLIYK